MRRALRCLSVRSCRKGFSSMSKFAKSSPTINGVAISAFIGITLLTFAGAGASAGGFSFIERPGSVFGITATAAEPAGDAPEGLSATEWEGIREAHTAWRMAITPPGQD